MNKKELPLCKPPAEFNTPILVVIGSNDAVVDLEAARETAQHYGQQDVLELPDIAHDLMLVSATSAPPSEVDVAGFKVPSVRASCRYSVINGFCENLSS